LTVFVTPAFVTFTGSVVWVAVGVSDTRCAVTVARSITYDILGWVTLSTAGVLVEGAAVGA